MKKLAGTGAIILASRAFAQEPAGATDPPPASGFGSNPDFMTEWTQSYANWDPTKVAWLVATIAVAYGIATFAFLGLMRGRSPLVAARYALFWGGLAFLLIHLFLFASLITSGLSLPMVIAIAVGIFVLVLVTLWLLKRKN